MRLLARGVVPRHSEARPSGGTTSTHVVGLAAGHTVPADRCPAAAYRRPPPPARSPGSHQAIEAREQRAEEEHCEVGRGGSYRGRGRSFDARSSLEALVQAADRGQIRYRAADGRTTRRSDGPGAVLPRPMVLVARRRRGSEGDVRLHAHHAVRDAEDAARGTVRRRVIGRRLSISSERRGPRWSHRSRCACAVVQGAARPHDRGRPEHGVRLRGVPERRQAQRFLCRIPRSRPPRDDVDGAGPRLRGGRRTDKPRGSGR